MLRHLAAAGLFIGLFSSGPVLGQVPVELADTASRVTAASQSAQQPGLSFSADEEDCGVNLLLCGELTRRSLSTRSCKGSEGTWFDLWFFPAYQGDIVAAAAISNSFSNLLGLYTPSPASLWDFDTAPVGEASAVGTYVHRTGIWGLSIGSQASSTAKTGEYLLLLRCGTSSRCKANPVTLCLGGGRYRVQVGYNNQFSNRYGFGGAVLPGRSTESGYFYFGQDPSNIELMVKILNFGDVVKVFWGQLTNLNYKIVVTDLATDESETYLSQPANCGGSDANAFADLGDSRMLRAASCRPGKNTACLSKGRFELTGTWRNQYSGASGQMGASRISDLTSSFFFGSAGNVELLAKVADLGNRIGFFYGAMSDLEYTLNVRDTVTGEVKTYHNPAGRYCGGLADLPK